MRNATAQFYSDHPTRDANERWSIRISWLVIAAASVGGWAAIGALVHFIA